MQITLVGTIVATKDIERRTKMMTDTKGIMDFSDEKTLREQSNDTHTRQKTYL